MAITRVNPFASSIPSTGFGQIVLKALDDVFTHTDRPELCGSVGEFILMAKKVGVCQEKVIAGFKQLEEEGWLVLVGEPNNQIFEPTQKLIGRYL